MKKLKTCLSVKIDDIEIQYGSIPSGVIDGWDGIVYYFKTYDDKSHEKVVTQMIEQLESQSYDHGSEWRETKVEAVVWNEYCQITLVSFRVKDSY